MTFQYSVKKDAGPIAVLISIAFIIYYPVLYTTYAYTDELVGLWQWNSPGHNPTDGLLQYGRYFTGKMGEYLFGSINTIHQLTWIRIVSLAGWLLSIPIWFFIIKRLVEKENLPTSISFFSVLYLICTPAVAISIGWAACFELFLANTIALMSGFSCYSGLHLQNRSKKKSILLLSLSILCGVICLFTYQNAFGCFLLPFLLHFIGTSKPTKFLWKGIVVYFLIYVVYYILFKLTLNLNHVEESTRTGLHINVGRKLPFFFARPLGSAFRFTILVNEKKSVGYVIYAIIAATWFLFTWFQKKEIKITDRIKYFVIVFCLLGLIYLPSLIVTENYSSNRTMLALSMAVFFLVASTLLFPLKFERSKLIIVTIASVMLVGNGVYNFRLNFLSPVNKEYNELRSYIDNNYKSEIDTINFIRPPEDFFEKKYGVIRSWDEFGVPSTFFQWTPEFLVKQIVFEKTNNRAIADKLIVQSAIIGDSSFHPTLGNNVLLINAPEILK